MVALSVAGILLVAVSLGLTFVIFLQREIVAEGEETIRRLQKDIRILVHKMAQKESEYEKSIQARIHEIHEVLEANRADLEALTDAKEAELEAQSERIYASARRDLLDIMDFISDRTPALKRGGSSS